MSTNFSSLSTTMLLIFNFFVRINDDIIKLKNVKKSLLLINAYQQKKTFDRINICTKMNLINHDFVQILKLFLCINVQVINVQKINDKILKKQVVYFV